MFVRVSSENGLWTELARQWSDRCLEYGEVLEDYAQSSLSVVAPLAESAQLPTSGVFAVKSPTGEYSGLCQLNVAFLPGYTGKVVRVRHIVLNPKFEFSPDVSLKEYEDFLGKLLLGVFDQSEAPMSAPHIKFHFKSPSEREFFSRLKDTVLSKDVVKSAEIRGTWLYIEK